jgi:hypothetical protein
VKAIQTTGDLWSTDPLRQKFVSKALRALNDLERPGTKPANQQDAELKVKPIIDDLAKDIPSEALGPRVQLASVHELQIRNERLNVVAWGLWFAISVSLGIYLLIAMQPGFGTSSDLWKCFFWGLGISVAGQQFNPSTVTGALNITLPKA